MATMIPANICSGFRKCSIYPYNPDTIDCSISTNNPSQHQGDSTSDNDRNRDGYGDDSRSGEKSDDHEFQSDPLSKSITFSAEKEQLFQLR